MEQSHHEVHSVARELLTSLCLILVVYLQVIPDVYQLMPKSLTCKQIVKSRECWNAVQILPNCPSFHECDSGLFLPQTFLSGSFYSVT